MSATIVKTDYVDEFFNFIWRPQFDGQGYHVDAGDTGGATSWGVTYAPFKEWWDASHANDMTLDIFRAMNPDDFKPYITYEYWLAIAADLMGPIGIAIADMDFTSGVWTAAQHLQMLLGFTGRDIDGDVGPMTLAALAVVNQSELNENWLTFRLAYYKSLKNYRLFGAGWTTRANACYVTVQNLLTPPAVID